MGPVQVGQKLEAQDIQYAHIVNRASNIISEDV